MTPQELNSLLQNICESPSPSRDDIQKALAVEDEVLVQQMFGFADSVRARCMGDGILLRGIVEFSNHCRNTCRYCGLQKNNTRLARYRLTRDELLAGVDHIASQGIRTVVLQSGEEDELDPGWLAAIIREVKARHDMAITLSVGERTTEEYATWRQAGADRYLLKIETADPDLYALHHPGMSFENRLRCLDDLRDLGYQVGSGCLVGLKKQTLAHLAGDICFFKQRQFEMIGIGAFIPHSMTELRDAPIGNVPLTLKVLALTRIATGFAHLPATTALGSIGEGDGRIDALMAGANVLMPNFTPLPYRQLYDIYPGKRCVTEAPGSCGPCMELMARSIGRSIDYSRGDALRMAHK